MVHGAEIRTRQPPLRRTDGRSHHPVAFDDVARTSPGEASSPAGGPADALALEALLRSVAMAQIGADGTFVYANERWCSLFRVDGDALVGQAWTMRVHPQDRDAVRAACREANLAQDGVRLEFRLHDAVTADDGPRWIGTTLRALDEDASAGWIATASDITDRLRAEEEAASATRRLDKIVNTGADLVVLLPADGSEIWASAAGQDLFGYDPADLADRDPFSFVHPDDLDQTLAAFRHDSALPTGTAGTPRQLRVATATGGWRWMEIVGVNMVEDPDIHGTIVHARDVTDRVQAAEALRRAHNQLRSLVDTIPLGVLLVGPDARVAATNRTFMAQCGFDGSPESIVGVHETEIGARLRSTLADPDSDLAELRRARVERQAYVHRDVMDRAGRVFERTYIPVGEAGENQGHIWLVRETTQERKASEERERLLEQEHHQNARLRELDALKSDFAASVSHELRTPLTSIVSFTELLKEGLGHDSEDEQREFLGIIARNTDRLLRLVDDLLLLDRLEEGIFPVVPAEVDVAEIVTLALSSLRPTAEERGIRLEGSPGSGPPLVGDGERIGQLVDILLNNALKFTGSGGSVRLDARYEAGAWRLTVADTGMGVPASDLPNLFKRFFRATNARQRAVTGSGLGLAIAHGIAELHHGDIQVDSAEGVGTTFTVTLRGAAMGTLPVSGAP